MKIVFIGCVKSSHSLLKTLLDRTHAEVIGIVTKEESNFNSDFISLSPIGKAENIPVFIYTKNDLELNRWLKQLKPDLMYCFGWSYLLSTKTLSIPKIGVVGFHPSKLPKNRGRHPIIWSIFLGLQETASTFFMMDKGADTGDIIHQQVVRISNNETATTLYEKIIKIASHQLIEFTNDFMRNNVKYLKQDSEKSNNWRKRSKLDGKIDWRMSCIHIDRLVRALTHPYVGAHCNYEDKEFKIWSIKANITSSYQNFEPGKIISIENDIIEVKCADGVVHLIDHEFKNMPEVNDYMY